MLTEAAGTPINDRYRVQRVLGQGATSLVLAVLDHGDRPRAIKVLRQDVSETLLRAEFSRLSHMAHPRLVHVHDLDRLQHDLSLPEEGLSLEAGCLFLVMDLVDGPDPVSLIGDRPEAERDGLLRGIAMDLALALAHVHGHGIVHHDVKPENVRMDADGRAVLLDLGLATVQHPRGSVARGTLPYMAPEGVVGGGDHRVDLYSMGATLFHLATGAAPFDGKGTRLIRRILEQQPSMPDLPWLSSSMEQLVLRLLRKDPLRRPGSARTVLAELYRMAGEHDQVAELASSHELLPPAFVGRESAMEQLHAANTRGGVVLVVGDAGTGKTRLIQEAVTRGRIDAAAGRGPARELLIGSLREAVASLAGEGATLDRWIEGEDPADTSAGLAMQLIERLEREAGARPLSIVLPQDAQSDPVACRLMEALLADEEATSDVLVVGETHPQSSWLQQLGQHARLVRIDIDNLDPEQTADLVGSMLGSTRTPPEVAAQIHELSSGNPALVVELTRLYNDQGVEGLDLERVGLDEVLARDRGWLDGDQRAVMDALAVWGESASGEELAHLVHGSEEAVWDAVHQLAPRGRVVVDAGGVRLPSPAHVTAWRRALSDPGLQQTLHRRAIQLLDPDAPDPRRAYHMLAAGTEDACAVALELARGQGATTAIPLLEQVVSRTTGARHDESALLLARAFVATARYDEALALLDASPRPDDLLRAELLQKRGDYADAERLLRELIPRERLPGRRKAAALLARLMLGQGRSAEALEVAQAHLPVDGIDPPLQEACGLAQVYLGQLDQAEQIFRQGERALLASGDDGQLARFASFRGMVALSAGHNAVAADHYLRAVTLAEGVGDVHGRTTYLANLGAVQLQLGRLKDALRHFTRAVRDLSRLARTTELASALCNLANLFMLLGDLEAAARTLARAASEASRLNSRHTAGFVAMLEADLSRRNGDNVEAERRYRQALAWFVEVGALREQVDCQLALCESLAEAGQGPQARQLLEQPWAEQPERRGEVALGWARLALSGVELERGDIEQELALHCERLEQQGARQALWRAATVLGALMVRQGRTAAARQILRRAADTREEIVKHAPDVYHESMAQDPDASLLGKWQQMLAAEVDPAQSSAVLYDRRWVRRILSINKRLNSELRLPNLLELILDTAIELTEAERGFLLLGDKDSELSIKVARNIDQRSLDGEELSLSRSIAEQAMQSGEPVVAIDAAEDHRFQEALSVSDLRLRSVLAVPLLLKGRAVGTIYVDHRLRQGVFGEDEVSLMQDIAEQAAIAMDNASLLAENQTKAEEIERLNHRLRLQVDDQQQELLQVREELRSSRKALELRYDYANIIGQTPRMLDLFRLLDRVTETDLPVVVQGESGTGKELVARAIHHNGPRCDRPFVGENCAAIPETLLESILFGHVKGAFTGAERDRKGLFEVASGGTLFLDEVGETSPAMQTKLLRVLQDGELRRVGGTQTISTDVRVIAASNRDLTQLVKDGVFREDLFYRLNVIQICIPPLRERRGDIPLLMEHFLAKHSREPGRRVHPEALALLMGYAWPGNVRELENEVMRAAALGESVIGPDDLSPQIAAAVPLSLTSGDDLDVRTRVEHLERELIQRAIQQTGGNNTQAARLLGLSRFGLLKKLQRYGVTSRPAKRQPK